MKNYYVLIMVTLMPASSLAQNAILNFNANVQESCTVVASQEGQLNLNGTTLLTTIPAQASIFNNSPGSFNITVEPPTSFSDSPSAFSGDINISTSSFNLSGQNIATNVQGSYTLTNSGNDTLSLSLSGTSNVDFEPGEYRLSAVVSCDAI